MKLGATESIKFKKLKMRLKLSHWQAVGLLESLWMFTSRNAPLGDIGRHSDEDIAAAIEWPDEPETLISALVDCRWVDQSEEHRLVIHDWSDHMPNWLSGNLAKHGKVAFTTNKIAGANNSTEHVAEQPTKHRARQPAEKPAKQPPETVLDPPEQPPSLPYQVLPSHSNSSVIPPNPQKGESATVIDVQEIVDRWNSTDGVVRCREVTDKRRKLIAVRARDPTWDWRSAMQHFPLRCFADSDRNWKPDIDWFLRPDTVLKIMEGKYDWEKGGQTNISVATTSDPRGNTAVMMAVARKLNLGGIDD